MYSIITGTILLGIIHALIPNHWLPLVAIARSEKWEKYELILVTSITASAHVMGTVILGIALGMVGSKLAHQYEGYVHVIAPVLLIIFGLIYFTVNRPHHHSANKNVQHYKKSKTKWVLIFAATMFLSPCLEVESLFLTAGAYGLNGILLIALVYAVISITGIITLVILAFKGVQMMNSQFIEHNEKRITGIVLIIVGIVTFFLH
jgi:nickel/cobalt transporter (NicO) family protein